MSFLTCCGRSRWTLNLLKIVIPILSVLLPFTSCAAQEPRPNQAISNILEEKFAFPPPIQWRLEDENPIEVSLIALAWGTANSPEMISKGRGLDPREKPEWFPDRPYALAMRFRATLLRPRETTMPSGLVRVKNLEGNLEYPSELTPSGFVSFWMMSAVGPQEIHFKRSNTMEYWAFFPVSPDQKEFLFQVVPRLRLTAMLSFRIIVKDNKFVIIKASPSEVTGLEFTKTFSGTVGAESKVNLQLTGTRSELSGTEQYAGIGKTRWLKGSVDSLGNFVLNEYYPKEQVTGIFQGKFSEDHATMTGYFSKPDGSRLQPFEFPEVGASIPPSQ